MFLPAKTAPLVCWGSWSACRIGGWSQGRRHQLATILVLACAAVEAGSKALTAIAEWSAAAPAAVLSAFGYAGTRAAAGPAAGTQRAVERYNMAMFTLSGKPRTPGGHHATGRRSPGPGPPESPDGKTATSLRLDWSGCYPRTPKGQRPTRTF